MISYADFITLLFAFFVVMYATSSVNEQRYRALSGALSSAFSTAEAPTGSVSSTDVPRPSVPAPASTGASAVTALATTTQAVESAKLVEPSKPRSPPVDEAERAEIVKNAERLQRMQKVAAEMDARLQSLVRDGQVRVTRGARGIAIEINAAVLFDPAKAELKPASFDALKSVADALGRFVEPLQIEGHSDDVPIATREYRSNWELSAARAASVARYLVDAGIAPSRIGIAGYAEYRPLVGNDGPESRARNRRVTLMVLSADDARPKEGLAPDPEQTSSP